MHKSKYLKILSTFSEDELTRFDRFVQSPYFNSRQQIRDLFTLVNQNRSDPDYGKLDLWKELFPEKSKNVSLKEDAERKKADKHVRKLLSDLAKLAEEFLEIEGLKKDRFGSHKYLQSELALRNLDNYYEANQTAHKKSLKTDPASPFHNFELERDEYGFLISRNLRPSSINLESVLRSLEEAYLINKLKYACEIQVYYRMVKMEKDIPHIHIDVENLPEGNPLLDCYLSLFQLLTEQPGKPGQKKLFLKIREQLNEYSDQFPFSEARNIYNSLQNYCVYELNQGKNRDFYLQRVFEIAKDHSRKEGEITPLAFKNVIKFALNLGLMEEALKLVEELAQKISKPNREEAVNMNYAQVYYHLKDYSKCRRYISKLNLNDNFYAIDARTLEWKSWVESGEPDSLEYALSRINNNIRYLNRNSTMPQVRKTPMLNRLKYARKILLGRTPKEKLREQINADPRVFNKDYLLDMLDKIGE